MLVRTSFAFASLIACGVAGSFIGCGSDDSNKDTSPADSGTDTSTSDVALDTAMAETPSDGCVSGPPPSGFTTLDEAASGTDKADRGLYTSIALDENLSPMIAYERVDGTESVSVWFTRWDRTCSSWTKPVKIDSATDLTNSARGIALAYDSTTKTIGVVYRSQIGSLGGIHHYELKYASAKLGMESTWKTEVVYYASPDKNSIPDNAAVAMANGKTWVVWSMSPGWCDPSPTGACHDGIFYTQRATGSGGDAGTDGGDASADDGGDAGSPTFPLTGPGWTPATLIQAGKMQFHLISTAVDSAGKPAIAYVNQETDGLVAQTVYFQRLDGSGRVPVMTGQATEDAAAALAFDGTKPRIAAYIHKDDMWASSGDVFFFVASNDGSSWDAPVSVPRDGAKIYGFFPAIAVGPGGKVVVGSNIAAGSDMPVSKYGEPKIAFTTDLKSFTLGGGDKAVYDGSANWLQLAFGEGGKVLAAFGAVPNGSKVKPGPVLWRE